jgi:type II secretory pathway pseudopilin PulG
MAQRMMVGKENDFAQAGFTYLAALFLVAAMGVLLAAVGIMWSTAQQRDKEQELLLIGEQFRMAIGMYYEKSPGYLKKYPETLDDLLQDSRQLATQRYLRKIYIDPMTRSSKWGLVQAPEGGIMGVHSLSEASPIKQANFDDAFQEFSGKIKYSKWKFIYTPTLPKIISTSPKP